MTVDDEDLQARLRDADPAGALAPADPARVARLVEETVRTETAGTRRTPVAWLAAAAAVVVLAGGGIWLARGDDGPAPPAGAEQTVTTLDASAPRAGRCMVLSADLLGAQELALDGTVTEVADQTATLEVTRWYAGGETDLVELAAPAADLTALIGAVQLEVGQRYLVAATDGSVAACGMSAAYTPELAALYAEAFGG